MYKSMVSLLMCGVKNQVEHYKCTCHPVSSCTGKNQFPGQKFAQVGLCDKKQKS